MPDTSDILFLGHCYEANKHDKIWGVIRTGDGALTFWGRRASTLSFKKFEFASDAMDQSRIKSRTYVRQNPRNWNDLLPEDFDGQVLLARLGQVKFA